MEGRTWNTRTTGGEVTINSSEVKIMQLLDVCQCVLSVNNTGMVIIYILEIWTNIDIVAKINHTILDEGWLLY